MLCIKYDEQLLIITSVCVCRALCYLKLDRFTEAKQDCDAALRLEPANKKAFYRRALANKGLKVRRSWQYEGQEGGNVSFKRRPGRKSWKGKSWRNLKENVELSVHHWVDHRNDTNKTNMHTHTYRQSPFVHFVFPVFSDTGVGHLYPQCQSR